jgi:hypothetical protein
MNKGLKMFVEMLNEYDTKELRNEVFVRCLNVVLNGNMKDEDKLKEIQDMNFIFNQLKCLF